MGSKITQIRIKVLDSQDTHDIETNSKLWPKKVEFEHQPFKKSLTVFFFFNRNIDLNIKILNTVARMIIQLCFMLLLLLLIMSIIFKLFIDVAYKINIITSNLNYM